MNNILRALLVVILTAGVLAPASGEGEAEGGLDSIDLPQDRIPMTKEEAKEKLRGMVLDLLKGRLEEGGTALQRVEQFEEGLADVSGKAELAKAVYDYAMTVNKIDTDVRNIERLVKSLPDEQQRIEFYAAYLDANPGDHLVNIDHVNQIVFGGAKIGAALAAEFGKSVVGGGTAEFINAAEMGMKVLQYVGEKKDLLSIRKVVEERVVRDIHGNTICLDDAQLSRLKVSPGDTLQRRYDDTVLLFEGTEVWMTDEIRKRLEAFAAERGLSDEESWQSLYALYVDEKAHGEERREEERFQGFLKEQARGQADPSQAECYEAAQKYYQDAVDWFPKLRNPGSFSTYSCNPQHSRQKTPPEPCCKTYYATRNNKGMWEEAWSVLQECGWKAEIESRRQALEKKKAECR